MTTLVASGALSAPQSALQGPEPLGTRTDPGSALHGAHRALPCPSEPIPIGSGTDAPRTDLSATHSHERGVHARKHAAPSAGASESLLAGSIGAGEFEP